MRAVRMLRHAAQSPALWVALAALATMSVPSRGAITPIVRTLGSLLGL